MIRGSPPPRAYSGIHTNSKTTTRVLWSSQSMRASHRRGSGFHLTKPKVGSGVCEGEWESEGAAELFHLIATTGVQETCPWVACFAFLSAPPPVGAFRT